MRRTGNTSAWPAIGIVIAGTSKIGFEPDCACAEPPCVAAPANASAPVAIMVLRSTVSICMLRFSCLLIFPETCLAPPFAPGKKIKRLRCGIKRPATMRAFWLGERGRLPLHVRGQFAAIGGKLRHHLLVQPDVHAGGI